MNATKNYKAINPYVNMQLKKLKEKEKKKRKKNVKKKILLTLSEACEEISYVL